MRTSMLLAAAAALGTAACAAGSHAPALSRADLLSEAAGPPDRSCRVAAVPDTLPAADLLVDSAALLRDAAALWAAADAPPGYVLLALRFDPHGINVRRDVIEHRVPPALADSLQKLVFAHRRTVAPGPREWGLRLRLDLGETPMLRVGRGENCPARPRDRGVMARGVGDVWSVSREVAALPSEGGTVWVRVSLDARGQVTDVRVERMLGARYWDAQVLAYVRSLLFVPATEDGHPVPGEASIALRMGR
jgi:TonB family protein